MTIPEHVVVPVVATLGMNRLIEALQLFDDGYRLLRETRYVLGSHEPDFTSEQGRCIYRISDEIERGRDHLAALVECLKQIANSKGD